MDEWWLKSSHLKQLRLVETRGNWKWNWSRPTQNNSFCSHHRSRLTLENTTSAGHQELIRMCFRLRKTPMVSFLHSCLTCMCGFICFQVSECDRLWFRYLMHCCRTRGVTYCFCRCWSTTLSRTWKEGTVRTALREASSQLPHFTNIQLGLWYYNHL